MGTMTHAILPSAAVSNSVQDTSCLGRTPAVSCYGQLVAQGFLRQEELALATAEARRKRLDVATILIDRYRIPKPVVGAALAEFYRCPFLAYDERMVMERELFKALSLDYLRMNHWVPLRRQND